MAKGKSAIAGSIVGQYWLASRSDGVQTFEGFAVHEFWRNTSEDVLVKDDPELMVMAIDERLGKWWYRMEKRQPWLKVKPLTTLRGSHMVKFKPSDPYMCCMTRLLVKDQYETFHVAVVIFFPTLPILPSLVVHKSSINVLQESSLMMKLNNLFEPSTSVSSVDSVYPTTTELWIMGKSCSVWRRHLEVMRAYVDRPLWMEIKHCNQTGSNIDTPFEIQISDTRNNGCSIHPKLSCFDIHMRQNNF
ncbi:uncharacterized protein LOC143240615 [Tachypleus tridentatus]|uniref:uncharacterized protein LOC143240615 n=1 Tax=Tachypleus tridentatus TaxID=6853 RepID=UPI003FD5B928